MPTSASSKRAARRPAKAVRLELAERIAQERRRLAKELHDTLGQSLTAIYLNAKFVERKLEKSGSKNTGDVSELGETIHQAVQELHGIMRRLLADAESFRDANGGSDGSRVD